MANKPQIEVESETYIDFNIDSTISDYQLVRDRDRDRRQPRHNPRHEVHILTDFSLISRESLQHSEPSSFEEAMNG